MSAPDSSPLTLSLQRQGESIVAWLSDGQSVQVTALQPIDWERVAALAAAPTVEAERALCALLLPPPIDTALRPLRARALVLQISPELDALPWERLHDGVQRLGDKFALSRRLIQSVAPASQPPRRAEMALPPRLWRLRGANFGEPPMSAAQRPHAGLQPANSRLTGHGAAAWRRALDEAGDADLWLLQGLQRPEALFEAAPPAYRQWPQLAIVCDAAAHSGPRLEAAARPCCVPLLLSSGARGEAWVDALVAALAEGCPLGEAVRRVRASGLHEGELRLYGDAQRVLVPADGAERDSTRQVSVMSFDLVASTALMERLGDERYSEMLVRFHQRCASLVRHHGGVADEPQGDDGVMCYFGLPVAHEHSARRAVAAALELAPAVADLGMRLRVGVATGRVAIQHGQPFGRVVHLAARLQSLAAPGSVVISAATRKLVQGRFATEPIGDAVLLKGITQPQALFRVTGPADAPAPGELPRHELTPFVGRDAALRRLLAAWQQARSGGGSVVVVSGEAGIGKSRLLREFRLGLQRQQVPIAMAVCRAESASSPMHAVIESLRQQAGLTAQDDAASGRAKIERRMPAAVSRHDPLALDLVAQLLGLGGVTLTATQRRRTLRVLLDWFRQAAREQPFCLIFDDVQWADPSMREMLDALAPQVPGLPLLMLVAQRDGEESPWHGATAAERIALEGLPGAQACELVRQACAGAPLPDTLVRLLAARADGVPLFLEESARMALEQAADPQSAPGLSGAALPDVPATIEDVLMARLDRLGPAKAMAQLCAVIGREFPLPLLHAVIEALGTAFPIADAAGQLEALQATGLVQRLLSPAGLTLRFKHALVRDAAHESLWTRDRHALHEAVAGVLGQRFPELAQARPELLALHLAQAGRAADAVGHWEAAARLAAAKSANLEAADHARSALQALHDVPDDSARDRTELRLQSLLASRLIAIEGYGAPAVESAYLRAAALAEALDDAPARARIDLGLEACYFMRADFERAGAIAQRALTASASAPDPMHRLQAMWAVANVDWHAGRFLAAIEMMDRCLAAYRPEYHRPAALQDPGVMCLCYSAWSYWELGDPHEAMRRIRRLLELTARTGHAFSSGQAQGFAASVYQFRGDDAAAVEHAERAIDICEQGGFAVWLAHARMVRGLSWARSGDASAGLAEMEGAYAHWTGTGAVVTRPLYLAMRAEGHLMRNEPARARDLLDEALALADANGEHYHRAELLRLGSEAALAEGEPARAAIGAEAAFDVARQQGKRAFALRALLTLARCGASAVDLQQRVSAAVAGLAPDNDSNELRAVRTLLMHEPMHEPAAARLSSSPKACP